MDLTSQGDFDVVKQKKRIGYKDNLKIIFIIFIALATLVYSKKDFIVHYFNDLDWKAFSSNYQIILNEPLKEANLVDRFQIATENSRSKIPSYDRNTFNEKSKNLFTGDIEKELLQLEQSANEETAYNAKYQRAIFYIERGLYEKSNTLLSELMSNSGYNLDDYNDFYAMKCGNYFQLGEYRSAKKECDKVNFRTADPVHQSMIITIERKLGNNQYALELAEQALIISSGDARLYLSRAMIRMNENYKSAKNMSDIIYDSDQVIKLGSGDYEALAMAYIIKGYIQVLQKNKVDGCLNIKFGVGLNENILYYLVEDKEIAKICNLK